MRSLSPDANKNTAKKLLNMKWNHIGLNQKDYAHLFDKNGNLKMLKDFNSTSGVRGDPDGLI